MPGRSASVTVAFSRMGGVNIGSTLFGTESHKTRNTYSRPEPLDKSVREELRRIIKEAWERERRKK